MFSREWLVPGWMSRILRDERRDEASSSVNVLVHVGVDVFVLVRELVAVVGADRGPPLPRRPALAALVRSLDLVALAERRSRVVGLHRLPGVVSARRFACLLLGK